MTNRRFPDDTDSVTRIPVTDSLDLHSFQPQEVPELVAEYLGLAAQEGYREVRLIHGKGRGVRRAEVIRLVRSHPLVQRFSDAPPERGGFGATLVWLRSEPGGSR